jgi:hypothetical protein
MGEGGRGGHTHTKNTPLRANEQATQGQHPPAGTHFFSKLQVPMEHSGAMSCSLKVDIEEAANSLLSCTGHLKPNDEKRETTCENVCGGGGGSQEDIATLQHPDGQLHSWPGDAQAKEEHGWV